MSADPSTDLLDGQQITVTGAGFAKNAQVALVECQAGAVSESDCDLDFLGVKADKTGAFTTPYSVSRFINVNGTVVDCAQPSGCDLAAADQDNLTDAATTVINFQDVTVIPPTLSVDPSTGLLDGQQVTVTGANFTPDTGISVEECQTSGAADGSGCDFGTAIFLPADDTGAFSTSYDVTRLIQGENGQVDCAGAGACVLEAVNENFTQMGTAPLAFAHVRIKPVTLHVAPARNLVDGQSVTVTGKNFRPLEDVVISECPAKAKNAEDCGVAESMLVTADASGNIQATFDAARQLDLGFAEIDCAHAACALTAADASGFGDVQASSNRMQFDPDVPTLPPLTLKLKVGGTGTITGGGVELTATVSCSSHAAVEVDYDASVVQGTKGQTFGAQSGQVECTNNPSHFTVDVPSLGRSFKAGAATVEFDAEARTGSSAAQDELTQPVTLAAGGGS